MQGKCTRFVPREYMVMMQMPEFEFKHELSLLIPTNSCSELILVIQLFSDMPCVFVFLKSVSNFFTKLKTTNLAVETFAKTDV